MLNVKKCPPFCSPFCSKKHHKLLVRLLNVHEKGKQTLERFKRAVEEHNNIDPEDPIPDANRDYRYPLLHWAAVLGKASAVEFLISYGHPADVKSCITGETAMHRAVKCLYNILFKNNYSSKSMEKRFESITKMLAKALFVADDNGNTPLHACAIYIAELSVPAEVSFYNRALEIMVRKALEMETEEYLSTTKVINWPNLEHNTILHILAGSNKEESYQLVELLLQNGANTGITNKEGNSSFTIAKNTSDRMASLFRNELSKDSANRDFDKPRRSYIGISDFNKSESFDEHNSHKEGSYDSSMDPNINAYDGIISQEDRSNSSLVMAAEFDDVQGFELSDSTAVGCHSSRENNDRGACQISSLSDPTRLSDCHSSRKFHKNTNHASFSDDVHDVKLCKPSVAPDRLKTSTLSSCLPGSRKRKMKQARIMPTLISCEKISSESDHSSLPSSPEPVTSYKCEVDLSYQRQHLGVVESKNDKQAEDKPNNNLADLLKKVGKEKPIIENTQKSKDELEEELQQSKQASQDFTAEKEKLERESKGIITQIDMKRKEIEQLQKTWKENERAIEELEGQITEEDLRQGKLKNEIVVYDSILKCLDKE